MPLTWLTKVFEQVVPTNIEKQMMTHPAIEEVGVVGLPHEVDGEWPLAFVVLRKGVTVTAEELIDHTNSNMGKYIREMSYTI